MKFCACFFYYSHSHNTEKFNSAYLLLWALCNIFWSVLGILLNVPRNLKHSFHTLHECLGITDMQWSRVWLCSALGIFSCFWSILYYVPQILCSSYCYMTFPSGLLLIFLLDPSLTGGPIKQPLSVCLSVSSTFFQELFISFYRLFA